MCRFIVQPDKTSSSEYEIYDVIARQTVASGLDLQEAIEGKKNREQKWDEEKNKIGY